MIKRRLIGGYSNFIARLLLGVLLHLHLCMLALGSTCWTSPGYRLGPWTPIRSWVLLVSHELESGSVFHNIGMCCEVYLDSMTTYISLTPSSAAFMLTWAL